MPNSDKGRSAFDMITDPKNRPAVKAVLDRLEKDIKAEAAQHDINANELVLSVWITLTRLLYKTGVSENTLRALVPVTASMADGAATTSEAA